MKKILSLIKTSLNHDMDLFKISTKKKTIMNTVALPLILVVYIMLIMGFYAWSLMEKLDQVHLEYFALTIFGVFITFFTFLEGIYKSGPLLFNCKDDQLMFSLPIKKSTVLFVRMLKFYLFELLFNSLFLLPAMVAYAIRMNPSWTYYLSSIISLIILPIIPVALSCLIGFIITYLSSKVKGKNLAQILLTTLFLFLVFYMSYHMNDFVNNLAAKASSINDLLTKVYYPIGAYISLVTAFKFKTLLLYILSHILIALVTIYILGKIYFKINSNFKKVATSHNKKHYVVKTHSRPISFMKKEFNRFATSPVFVTNAGFGLVFFIIGCIAIAIKYDSLLASLAEANLDPSFINGYIPVFLFAFLCFTTLMTSITSSMISLESKSFNILKSLPVEPFKIVLYKVLTAITIMLPFIFAGDLIIFIRFKFDLLSIILILIASIVLSLVAELIGILFNLKYPKLDATNDTEIVKQSLSPGLSVFAGMGLMAVTYYFLFKLLGEGLNGNLILSILLGAYILILGILWYILVKTADKSMKNITT